MQRRVVKSLYNLLGSGNQAIVDTLAEANTLGAAVQALVFLLRYPSMLDFNLNLVFELVKLLNSLSKNGYCEQGAKLGMFQAIVMIHNCLISQLMAHLSVNKRHKFFKYILQIIERMVQ